MANEQTLRELMIDELRDLYNAEKQLTKALPKLAKAASSDDLRNLLESHLGETETHVERLEQAFEALGEKVRGKHCAGIAGIIEEGSDLLQEDFEGPVLDAGIIAGAQRSEHYEIAAYGSVMAWAKALGLSELASLLDQTLDEEKAADEKLTALAESSVNVEAASVAEDEEDEADEDEESDRGRRAQPAQAGRTGRQAGRRMAGKR
jgi:ferritin-like metal-binding protein YciE